MNEGTNHLKLMGFESPGDKKIPVPLRDWNAFKLVSWRSKVAFEVIQKAAERIIPRLRHVAGCPGKVDNFEPCDPACEDRETRMDALVILNAARVFAPVNANRPTIEVFIAPSREYFSEVMAELGATQIELERCRSMLRAAGHDPNPQPTDPAPLPAAPAPLLEEPK